MGIFRNGYISPLPTSMSFTFRQLEVFVEAAKDCNFRKTADRLGISQPSVSNQVRALERRAGGELFVRSRGSTPRLSAHGSKMLAEAQQLLASKGRLVPRREARASKERLRLRIGAGPYLLDHIIRPALPRFLQDHPDIVLDFLPPIGATSMRRAVRLGEADLAVFTVGKSARQRAGAEYICDVPCSLYAGPRLARQAARAPSAIASLPFLLPLESSETERWILRTLRKNGMSPNKVVARSQFADVIADMIVGDQGISVLFDEHMLPHVRAGRAARIGPSMESGMRVLLQGQRTRSDTAAPFVEFMRALLQADPVRVA